MINIQISEEDLLKLINGHRDKKSESLFTLSSILAMILNIAFVAAILFLIGVIK